MDESFEIYLPELLNQQQQSQVVKKQQAEFIISDDENLEGMVPTKKCFDGTMVKKKLESELYYSNLPIINVRDLRDIDLDLREFNIRQIRFICKNINNNKQLISLKLNLEGVVIRNETAIAHGFRDLKHLRILELNLSKTKLKQCCEISISIATLKNIEHIHLDVSQGETYISCTDTLLRSLTLHRQMRFLSINLAKLKRHHIHMYSLIRNINSMPRLDTFKLNLYKCYKQEVQFIQLAYELRKNHTIRNFELKKKSGLTIKSIETFLKTQFSDDQKYMHKVQYFE